MVDEFKAPFAFVIDTNQYAGNFERELCAYITGRIGDCQVGEVNAAKFQSEVGEPFENVVDEADDHGCRRPVSIFPTPGWFNDGMGGHYEEGVDLDKVTLKYRGKLVTEAQKQIDRVSAVIPGTTPGWTQEAKDRELKMYQQKLEDAKTAKPGHYPAYQSVAIFFSKKPTPDEIKIMKERTEAFKKLPAEYSFRDYSKIKILGFRLITTKIEHSEVAI